tara:strand:- start:43 stop:1149 length:1107 start_codon:yes stop_codon:yes gene_type:complete
MSNPIIGKSPPMNEIRRLIDLISDSDATVLVNGESGTGKELVAQALHFQSNRSNSNFVPLNCAAIPNDLMESELFGHKRGSFTGALTDRVGRFELAHGGTLFLDEIGDLTLEMQVKLLRVLQEKKVDPIGSSKPVSVDVRVIAATHRDLDVEISEGRFREDLFYRLNVLPIVVPPLRERGDDITLLLKYYSEQFSQKERKISFSKDFCEVLKKYNWPGNVRELSNLVKRFSTLFAGKVLSLNSIPSAMLPKGLRKIQDDFGGYQIPLNDKNFPSFVEQNNDKLNKVKNEDNVLKNRNNVEEIILLAQGASESPNDGLSLKQRMAQIEKVFIEQALDRSNGNVSKTARLLNLQRTTLIEKIDKYRLRSA